MFKKQSKNKERIENIREELKTLYITFLEKNQRISKVPFII